MSSVENQADVVEGGGHEAAGADASPLVLVVEGFLEEQWGEEDTDGWDEKFQFRAVLGTILLVRDLVTL